MGYEVEDDGVIRLLTGVGERLRDPEPLLQVIAAALKEFTDDRFRRGVDPAGEPWAPLKPETVARKGSDTILEDTGNLRNSTFARSTGDGVEFGTVASYAAPHHFGGRKLPRRRWLPVDDNNECVNEGEAAELLEDIEAMVAQYFADGTIGVSAA